MTMDMTAVDALIKTWDEIDSGEMTMRDKLTELEVVGRTVQFKAGDTITIDGQDEAVIVEVWEDRLIVDEMPTVEGWAYQERRHRLRTLGRWLLVVVAVVAVTMGWRLACMAQASPDVYQECLQRDMMQDLLSVHLTAPPEWEVEPVTWGEWRAIRAITRDGQSKNPVDVVRTDCGAQGWAHFQPADPFGIGMTSSSDCPYHDPEWRYWTQAVLYSDWGPVLQVIKWRDQHAWVLDRLAARGWDSDELIIARALRVSLGATGLLRLARECQWRSRCVVDRYATTDHRRRRLAYLRRVGVL